MFGHAYFSARYFPAAYFGPAFTAIILDSLSSAAALGDITAYLNIPVLVTGSAIGTAVNTPTVTGQASISPTGLSAAVNLGSVLIWGVIPSPPASVWTVVADGPAGGWTVVPDGPVGGWTQVVT